MKKKVNYFKMKLLITVGFFSSGFIFLAFQMANINYEYNGEYDIEIIDTRAEKLDSSYQNYEVREGNELYKIEHQIQNNTGMNFYGSSIFVNYDMPEAKNTLIANFDGKRMEDYIACYSSGEKCIIPAGMKGKKRIILEVPKGTAEINASIYTKAGIKNLIISLL